jgi:thiol-disulfide isomerase/thioredoxin
MKQLFLLVFSLFLLQNIDAQGIEFFHGTFKEALEKAQKENKLVFMDAYAEWCGPCKNMAATVFKDEKVGKFFNDNFVNVKMDMEKGEGPSLQGKYGVSAYPTLLFINSKGDLVHRGVGALRNSEFLELAKKAMGKNDNSKEFEKAYNEGKRDPDLVYNYVRALNAVGKPAMKIVNEYLQKADMSNPTTLKIIYEGTSQVDSKIFDLLITKRAQIVSLYSEQQVKEKIENACEKTLENALQFKSTDLHKLAKDKMKAFLPEKAEEFGLLADLKFYQVNGNSKDFCKTCETLIKKEGKTDARKHFSLAKQMIDAFPNDKNVLNDAEKYFKKAAEYGGLSEYYYWYAQTLLRNGKKKDAMTSAEKALKLARELAPNYVPATEQLIEQIKTQG